MILLMKLMRSAWRATIVGPSGKQADMLRQRVGPGVLLRILAQDRALHFRGNDSDVVILMRFVGHKHERHLRRVAACPIIFLRVGGVDAVLRALDSVLNTNGHVQKEEVCPAN